MRAGGRLIGCLLAAVLSGVPIAVADVGAAQPVTMAAAVDRRGEEQTFLTFPEWFLVFSPAEYADFVRTHTPDQFCFWGHIGQFWRGYAAVIHENRVRHEPANWGYHLMIIVIGVSTTVEYAARSAYETIVGRVSAATLNTRTPEDDFAAQAAQQYVDFIRISPWYQFDFIARLKGLWRQTTPTGPHMLRKWERKYALTTEYLVKAIYGKLIAIATSGAYDAPIPTTSVVVDRWPVCDRTPAGVIVGGTGSGGETILALPRYEPFRAPAVALARCGAGFREIAGNRTIILLSAIGAASAPAPPDSMVMMRQPIITRPGRERIVLIVPVVRLASVLNGLDSDGLALEHIFDY
jgi:hypothetical protein